ncbi:alpha/beta hydrolase, partial (plasmid) [Tunturiibacter empetritectus]
MTLPRIAKRILTAVLFLLGLAVSVMVSLVVAYQTARIVPRIGLLVVVALLVFFLGVLLTAELLGKLSRTFLNRSAVLTSAALTPLFVLGLYLAVLRPMHYPRAVPVARANTLYWNLPTGSRIAYSVYEPPAGVPLKADPILFVHGGPGARAFDTDHAFYRQFAQDGFRVYLFDQAGSGLSDRLPAADYTVERFVADMEAIRQQIGSERLILIGHSWGGTLVAHYAAAHPDHVAKLIFHSPGGIWNWASAPMGLQRTDAQTKEGLPPLRVLAAIVLSHANWNAAENLLPQQESGDWQTATSPVEFVATVCKGERSKLPADLSPAYFAGMNLYPLLVAQRELNDKPEMDIRAQLGKLHVPAIALESQCDFVPWSQQVEYKKSIFGLHEFYFADAGHYINFSQPDKLTV